MVVNSSYPLPLLVPDAACITALAAANCAADRLLKASPLRQLKPHGRLDHLLALVKLRSSITDACCAVVKVAKKVLARHTTLATPVRLLQSVLLVAAEATVNDRLHDCPPKLMAKSAVPEEAGVPVMVYVRLPAPLASVPACKVAVSPVTPVEEIAVPAA